MDHSVIVIKEQLKALVGLQEIDARILNLQQRLEQRPREEAIIRTELDAHHRQVQECEAELKALQVRRKERELDLETKEVTIKKYQAQLLQVKTNKEYSALQAEIDGLKADNSLLEEAILVTLEEIDRAKKSLGSVQESYKAQEQRMQEHLNQVREAAAGWERELAEAMARRHEMAAVVDRLVLAQYDRVLKNRRGVALVPVLHDSCSGCHMGLPPQVINEIRIGERLIVCESCARILYIPESS